MSAQSDLNEDIVYAQTGNTAEEYQSNEQQEQHPQQQQQQHVQYVTPSQYEQQKGAFHRNSFIIWHML